MERRIKSSITLFGTFLALYLFLGISTTKGDWKSDANARIEANRKRNAQITVIDANSNPVPDINVQIEQVKHRFAFGTCIAYSPLNSNTAYKNFILSHFEWAVCENETKWGSNEPSRDSETYTQADNIYNWCNTNGIKMRGHCLFWEQNNSNMPTWVPGLAYATYPTASDLLSEVDERLNSAVNHFKNKFYNWDVDNEMLSDSFFTTRLGTAGIVHMFNASKAIDPSCGMFMNEYSGNSFGGYDSGPYVTRANSLISQGATIDGYGIQAHLAENVAFQPQTYYTSVLQPLAALGKPIWATEFDASHTDATVSADNIENFMRICFSHSSVEGIMFWGFMNGQMWRTNAGLCDSSGNLTIQGQRYEALMNEWTTNDTNYSDLSGQVNFRGFHGSYEITLSAPGQTPETHLIELEPGTTISQFTLLTDLHSPVPDANAPTPNPMTWATAPSAISPSAITMTATTASDATPPVQYYFECTNHGEANSVWQTSPTYIAQGLYPSTLYSFRVKARDSSSSHNETVFSNILSATTQPPGADIVLLGSWVSDATHAKENGYSRALILIAHEESTTGNPALTSVTYGGQPMTKVIEVNAVTTGGFGNYVAAFILNEAGVAAATNSTFVPTWSATTSSVAYASAFFSNANQTTLIGATARNSTIASTPNPITTSALSTTDGDMVILGATCGNLGAYGLNNGFTEGIDQAVGSSGLTGVTGHKLATGVAETPSATYSTGPNRQAIVGLVLQAAPPPPTYPDCNAVKAGGYGLESDLNGDCYVDLLDLEIIASYWLNTNCAALGNCQGADFAPTDGTVNFLDFADFGPQWMQCNNPEDPYCTPNW
jgi:GH35 family endo-1,4-beta-xylanase